MICEELGLVDRECAFDRLEFEPDFMFTDETNLVAAVQLQTF